MNINPMEMLVNSIFGGQQQFSRFMQTGQMTNQQQEMFNNALNNFRQNFQMNTPNVDPEAYVRQMINSGQVNPQTFEYCRRIANSLTGKNL